MAHGAAVGQAHGFHAVRAQPPQTVVATGIDGVLARQMRRRQQRPGAEEAFGLQRTHVDPVDPLRALRPERAVVDGQQAVDLAAFLAHLQMPESPALEQADARILRTDPQPTLTVLVQ
ncbi:hypothetical protein BEN78_08410 [Xanthomonas citri pv. mangiferaeindicae]|nr:hypothetical protein BEN78_08410 [Xanthomonas citri pv. mangiferaeindicae]